MFYLVSMWSAGITQWSMWRAVDENGQLVYPNFIDTVLQLMPFYYIRLGAGLMYLTGMLMLAYNFFRTVNGAPASEAAPAMAK